MKQQFIIKSQLWEYPGEHASWYFMSVDKETSEYIKSNREPEAGFGSIKGEFTIGTTTWQTSLFPSKTGEYCIPIKKSVRKAEGLTDGDQVDMLFRIL